MSSVVIFIVLFSISLSLAISRWTRLVVLWGGVWGFALGFLLLAPRLLQVHRLVLRSPDEWAVLISSLAIIFALLGVVLAVPALLAVAIPRRIRGHDLPWIAGGVTLLLLPIAYLSLSIWIEISNFARPPSLLDNRAVLLGFLPAHCIGVLTVLRFSARLRRRTGLTGGRLLALSAGGLIVVGLGALPLWAPDPHQPSSDQAPAPLQPHASKRSSAPLLVIGLDSGNWQTVDPLLRRGRLPTLERLISNGVRGRIEALWKPYWSTPAWAAIATGHTRERTGVYEDLAAKAPGLPPFELPLSLDITLNPLFLIEYVAIQLGMIEAYPPPRHALREVPIWERLSAADIRTAVVRFHFTYPADRQADIVISNRVVTDLWQDLGVRRGEPQHLVHPAERSQDLLRRFEEGEEDLNLFKELFPPQTWPKPSDAIRDPVAILRTVLDIDRRMLDASEDIIRASPDVQVLMVHVAGFDNVCHAFWQYRFPEAFPDVDLDARDVEHLGPVIDRYLEFLDRRLGALIAAFPSAPNVLVVSDHGHEATHSYPLWKGWHAREALFIAGGPDVPATVRPQQLAVSYFDVVPTMLHLLGLSAPADQTGRVAWSDSSATRDSH